MRRPNRAVAGLRTQSRRAKSRRRANPKLVKSTSTTSRTRRARKRSEEDRQANARRVRRRASTSSSRRAGNARKTSSRRKTSTSQKKYGPRARKIVGQEMREFKQGKLKSGGRRKVTNPKQAIAIGISEARRAGAKVPAAPRKKAA